MFFNDDQIDVLYDIIISCGVDYARKNGKDDLAEDVVLFYDFIQNVTCIELAKLIVNKLKEKGYEIKRSI